MEREGFSEISAAVVGGGGQEDMKGEETLTQRRREEPAWRTAGRGPLRQCWAKRLPDP